MITALILFATVLGMSITGFATGALVGYCLRLLIEKAKKP